MKVKTIILLVVIALYSQTITAQSVNIDPDIFSWCTPAGSWIEGPNYNITYTNTSTWNNGLGPWIKARGSYDNLLGFKVEIRTMSGNNYQCNQQVNFYKLGSITPIYSQVYYAACNSNIITAYLPNNVLKANGGGVYYVGVGPLPNTQSCINTNTCATITGNTNNVQYYWNTCLMGKWLVRYSNSDPCIPVTQNPLFPPCVTQLYNADLSYAESGLPSPPCGNKNGNGEFWVRTRADWQGGIIAEVQQASGSAMNNTLMAIYTNSCGNLTYHSCDDNSGPGQHARIEASGFTTAQDLWLMICADGTTTPDAFNLCLEEMVVVPVAPSGILTGCGTYTINYSKNFSGPIDIQIVLGSTVIHTIATNYNSASNSVTFTLPQSIATGSYQIKAMLSSNNNIRGYSLNVINVQNACGLTNPSCTDPAQDTFCDLMDWLVIRNRANAYPDDYLIRQDAAAALYNMAVNSPQGVATPVSDKFPIYNKDLMQSKLNFFKFMTTLHWVDLETAMKTQVNYQPETIVQYRYWIQMLWEINNLPKYTVPVNSPGPAPTFTTSQGVILPTDYAYQFLLPAWEMGILRETSNLDAPIKRRRAFQMAWEVRTNLNTGWSLVPGPSQSSQVYYRPSKADLENPSHYKIPFYNDLLNFAMPKDLGDGIFGTHAQGGISISGEGGVGCSSAFLFNGIWEKLPEAFRAYSGMGENINWTTNYTDYVCVIQGSSLGINPSYDVLGNETESHWAIRMSPNGLGYVYQDNLSFGVMTPYSHNTYDKLERLSATEIQFTDRESGVKKFYQFMYKNKSGSDIYMLTAITDRYGNRATGQNTTTLQYESGQVITLDNGTTQVVKRLKYVIPSGGNASRRFSYYYATGSLDKLERIDDNSLGHIRSVTIHYDANNNIDIISDPQKNDYSYMYQINDPWQLQGVIYPEGNGLAITMQNHFVSQINKSDGTTIVVSPNVDYVQNKITKNITVIPSNNTLPNDVYVVDADYYADYGQSNHGYTMSVNHTRTSTASTAQVNDYNYTYGDPQHIFVPTRIEKLNGLTQEFGFNNGHLTSYKLIGSGGVASAIHHQYDYNATNNQLEIYTDPEGNKHEFGFDGAGGLELIYDAYHPSGNGTRQVLVQLHRDNLGQVERVEHSTYGGPVLHDLNMAGYQLGIPQMTQIGNQVMSQTIDGAGRLVSQVLQGDTYAMQFDDNDNNTLASTPGGKSVESNYTGNDELEKLTTHLGDETTFAFDPTTRFITQMSRFGENITVTYDAANSFRLNTVTDENGITRTMQYYGANSVHENFLQDDGYAVYSYWNSGAHVKHNSLQTVTHKVNGSIRAYDQDEFGRMVQEICLFPNNHVRTMNYGYDKRGLQTWINYPHVFGSKQFLSPRDQRGNLTELRFDGQLLISYSYYADGRPWKKIFSNGNYEEYSYDGYGNVEQVLVKNATNTIIGGYKLLFDKKNEIDKYLYTDNYKFQNAWPSRDVTYVSDPLTGQLTNVSGTIGGTAFNMSPMYNDKGEMTSFSGTSTMTNIYDILGNLVSLNNNSSTFQSSYDGLGHRIETTKDGVTTRYVLDTRAMGDVMMELDASNNIICWYLYDDDGLIARVDASTNQVYYYHFNWRGDTKLIIDGSGAITNRYAYSPWGEVWESLETVPNHYKFSGQYGVRYDYGNLYFHRARYYNPLFKKFYSRDGLWHPNPYQYAEGNPISYVDPSGNESLSVNGTIWTIHEGEFGRLPSAETSWHQSQGDHYHNYQDGEVYWPDKGAIEGRDGKNRIIGKKEQKRFFKAIESAAMGGKRIAKSLWKRLKSKKTLQGVVVAIGLSIAEESNAVEKINNPVISSTYNEMKLFENYSDSKNILEILFVPDKVYAPSNDYFLLPVNYYCPSPLIQGSCGK